MEKDFKFRLDKLSYEAPEARLRSLGISDMFVKRLKKYITLLYEDDDRFLNKKTLMGFSDTFRWLSQKNKLMGFSNKL